MAVWVASLLSTIVGGIISALVAFLTIRGTLENQLQLEERKFEYQKTLEEERRDHEASAFRRTVLRVLQRLHNTSNMNPKTRVSVRAWKTATEALKSLLESEDCTKSLDDARYNAIWRACDESSGATLFLEIWGANQGKVNPQAPLLSLREYYIALEECFIVFGDTNRAETVHKEASTNFKGVGFWLGSVHEDAAYLNP